MSRESIDFVPPPDPAAFAGVYEEMLRHRAAMVVPAWPSEPVVPPATKPSDAPALPCWPCPHDAACCEWGATLADGEAAAIAAIYGHFTVHAAYDDDLGEYAWRTAMVSDHAHPEREGRCIFLRQSDRGCVLYGTEHYPRVCRGFPWTESDLTTPYSFEVAICPEFRTRPELVQLARAKGEIV